jgi:hypothetical protein
MTGFSLNELTGRDVEAVFPQILAKVVQTYR